jgi:hypothetical protein
MPHLVANKSSVEQLRYKQIVDQTPCPLIPIICGDMVRLERQAFSVLGVLCCFGQISYIGWTRQITYEIILSVIRQRALGFQGTVDLGHGVYPHDAFEREVRHGRVT